MIDRLKVRPKMMAAVAAVVVVVATTSSIVTWSLTPRLGTNVGARNLHECSGDTLPGFEQHQGAGGSEYVFIIWVNTAKHACTLQGFPSLRLLDGSGKVMRHEPQRHSTTAPLNRVVVAPGGDAGFVMSFPDGAVPGLDPPSGCRSAATLEVMLPHVTQSGQPYIAYFQIPLAPCAGGGFLVSALQRGLPLA
jgi:Protein of unknown function (DUF4232)